MNTFQKAAALLGCRGGKAGTGKSKARSKNQCRLAAQKRWNKKRPVAERFWAKVKIGDADACWEWKASAIKQGYGQFHINGFPRGSHRVAWTLTHGAPEKGQYVLHKCDNKKCCNPAHLYLGTQKDNSKDAWQRNRIPKALGEQNSKAKLTDAQVLEILKATGERGSLIKLARQFQVSVSTLYGIRNQPKRWAHLKQAHGMA